MFKRKIYKQLSQWKKQSDGKTALLIEGARRVGKSTVVEEFAKNEYDSYIMIDFSNAQEDTVSLFNNISNLNYIFLQLQLQYHVELYERRSLIIFDEVQFCPSARQAIKSLVKDGRYDYIETGSLISIKKNVKNILIPSEEQKISMFSMDYEEFLWALGDTITIPLMKEVFEDNKAFGEHTNRRLLRDFRLYMLVGGMPQAVNEYISTNNFEKVDAVKRNILNLYIDDFRKIDPTGKTSLLFNAIPSELSKNSSRYQVSSVLTHDRANTVLEHISEIEASKTVLVAYHSNDPNVGLSNYRDLEKFKLYLSDTGLFTTLVFKDRDFTENIIYEKLLNDKLSLNLGYLYENVVAQTLACNGYGLFYYTFPNPVTRRNYEIDFLLPKKNKICPIEVKSSGYKKHTSLDAFKAKYSDRILDNYLIYTKDMRKEGDISFLPIYLAQFL